MNQSGINQQGLDKTYIQGYQEIEMKTGKYHMKKK